LVKFFCDNLANAIFLIGQEISAKKSVADRFVIDELKILDVFLRLVKPRFDGCAVKGRGYAPGAYSFASGMEYTHGGISLQECLIPDLTFANSLQGKTISVAIETVQWMGLRCRVAIKPPAEGLFAVLRSKANDANTNICAPKPFDNEGRAGLLVEDETLAGSATSLVIFEISGRVLSKQATIIGGDL
jgi:hypothetical protein